MPIRIGTLGLRTFLVMVAVAMAVASCRKPIPVAVGQPFDLRVRQAAHPHDTDLDLLFRRVAADSRCPRNAQCIWAGEARVAMEARIMKGTPESFEVVLPGGAAVPDSIPWTVFDGYRIRLVRLEPYPNASTPADTTAYVASFEVVKR